MFASISMMNNSLAELCEAQFWQIGWAKPKGHFLAYLKAQQAGELICFVAYQQGQYIGHVKLVWQPTYNPFRAKGIAEIQDLNVLPDYRRRGVGTALISLCESAAAAQHDEIGIGVSLHPGYNNAQRLYSKLGYVLDGHGAHYKNKPVTMGQAYPFDDELVVYFTKKLATAR